MADAGSLDESSQAQQSGAWKLFGIPVHRKIRTGDKQIAWSAVFIISLMWFTWGFHIFAGGQALTFTIQRYTKNPQIISLVMTIAGLIILSPAISYISDQIWTRAGRRRPFVIIAWIGACGGMFCFAFLPQVAGAINHLLALVSIPPVGDLVLLAIIIACYKKMWDGCATIEPLFLECVPPHQRGRFWAIRGVLFTLAVTFFYQVLWPVFDANVYLIDDTRHLYYLALELLGRMKPTPAQLVELRYPAVFFTGEQLIYIFAGSMFLLTGFFLLFCIKETKVAGAPNKRLRTVFLGDGSAARAVQPLDLAVPQESLQPVPAKRSVSGGLAVVALVLAVSLIDAFIPLCRSSADLLHPGMWGAKVGWAVMLLPALVGLYALRGFFTFKPSAPVAAVVFLCARALFQMGAMVLCSTFTEAGNPDSAWWHLSGILSAACGCVPYLLRSQRVKSAYSIDVTAALHRIPIVSFGTSYVVDVFCKWSNYAFYIVLIIPGLEAMVWGNFNPLMQNDQFQYSKASQALWAFPLQMLSMFALTPFAGWYSDVRVNVRWWLRAALLVFSAGCFTAMGWLLKTYTPADIRDLPDFWVLCALTAVTAAGVLSCYVPIVETMLDIVGREHARAWVSLLTAVKSMLNVGLLYLWIQMSKDTVLPIMVWMVFAVIGGTFGTLMDTFIGPMIYDYMPRSQMGTINSGKGFIESGLTFMIANFGAWWVVFYSAHIHKPAHVPYDYTSIYLLQFLLFVPAIWAKVYFIRLIAKGKMQKWGTMEVEGDAKAKEAAEQHEAAVIAGE